MIGPHDPPVFSRRIALAGGIASLLGLGGCSKSNPSPPPSASPPSRLFDADFAQKGTTAYRSANPPSLVEGTDYGITSDPLAPNRKIAWLDSSRKMTTGNSNPRAELESPPLILPAANGNTNDIYWLGLSFMLPAASAPVDLNDWRAISTGGFGPPWGGPSPLGLAIVSASDGGHYMQIGGDFSLRAPFMFDQWFNILLGYKFAYDGWVELHTSVGANNEDLRQVALNGQGRLRYDTMRAGSNDEWFHDPSSRGSYTSIGIYGPRTARALFSHHRLAYERKDALPFD